MSHLVGFGAMSLVWGLTWLPMKLASEAVPPIFLAAVRFILAGLAFGAYALATGLPLRSERWGRVLFASFVITTACYGTLFWGVARAPTGLSAVVNLALMPIFVIAIGAAYGEETVTARRLASLALGAAGLGLLFSTRIGAGQAEAGGTVVAGLAAVVVGTAFYAWGAIVSRPLVRAMPPVALAFWETLLGGLMLLPLSVAVEGYDPARLGALADTRAIVGLAVLVGGGSLTAFTIYLWLVRDWGPFRAGLYSFVSPVIAVAVGSLWAGEPFGWPEAAGMAVMLGATGLAIGGPSAPVSASAATGWSPGRRA